MSGNQAKCTQHNNNTNRSEIQTFKFMEYHNMKAIKTSQHHGQRREPTQPKQPRQPRHAMPHRQTTKFKQTSLRSPLCGMRISGHPESNQGPSDCDRRSQLTLMFRAWRPTDRTDRPDRPVTRILLEENAGFAFRSRTQTILHECVSLPGRRDQTVPNREKSFKGTFGFHASCPE